MEVEPGKGPVARGWIGDQRWTLVRVAMLIEQLFGAVCTVPGVSLLLRRNGWSCQVPGRRMIERDPQAIQVGKQQVWPQAEPPRRTWAPGLFRRRKRPGLRPPHGRSWSRRGHRSQVSVHGGEHHGRVQVLGLVRHQPGHHSRLIYQLHLYRRRQGQRVGFTTAEVPADAPSGPPVARWC
ncbi:helix-turn-helix domain-containing protein [Spirillospora sp. CA-253888]